MFFLKTRKKQKNKKEKRINIHRAFQCWVPEADVKDGAKISTKLSNVSDCMPKAKGEKKRETKQSFLRRMPRAKEKKDYLLF